MSSHISLKRNFIMNSLLSLSSMLFPLITFPYVSRVLGPDGTGMVTFANSTVAIFSMFAQLGIPTYGVRECAKVRDDKEALSRVTEELLLLNLLTSLAAFAALLVCTCTIPQMEERRSAVLLMSVMIFLNMLGMEWLFQGLEQYSYITIRSLVFKVIGLAGLFLLVRGPGDVLPYAGITVFSGYASQLLNFFYARKFLIRIPLRDLSLKRHLKPVLVFFAMACATTVYTNLDNLMLGFMAGDAEVGYYHAAIRVKQVLVAIVTSLGTVLLPRASYYVKNGEMERFRAISDKALRFVFFAALPLAVFFLLGAEDTILVLSGQEFLNSVTPMRIIMPTVLFIGITNITGMQMLIPLGRETDVFRSEAAGALTDLVLNALLIPRLQSSGAALGTLAAEFVVLLVQFFCIRQKLPGFPGRIHIGNYIAGTAFGSLACLIPLPLITGSGILYEMLRLCLSAALFAAAYFGWLARRRDPFYQEMRKSLPSALHRRS